MANLRVDKITSTETFETTGSVQFDGADDHLNLTSSDIAFGTGDFTLECWVYFSSKDGSLDCIMETRSSTSASDGFLFGRFQTSGHEDKIELYTDGTYRITGDVTTPDNTWVHVAVVRESGTTKLYVNGTASSSIYSDSNNYSNDDLIIGENVDNNYQLDGFISNFRMVKGTAVYTANFKPPMRELEVTPETVLLACQSKTDASLEKTGKTLTVTSAVASELTPGILTPVPKAGAGSAITGSVEFDGSGDYLTLANSSDFNFGTGDFTVECFIHVNKHLAGATDVIVSTYQDSSNGWTLGIHGHSPADKFYFAIAGDSSQLDSSVLYTDSWVHLAASRSGSTAKLFINGVEAASASNSTNQTSTSDLHIGTNVGGGSLSTEGFISNLRVVKGTALYTDDFIPPTRELKKVPGTVLLCCQDPDSPLTEATGKTITPYGNLGRTPGEYITFNRTFDSNIDDWEGYNSTPSYDTGRLKINASTQFDGAQTENTVTVQPNRKYILRVTVELGTAGGVRIQPRVSDNSTPLATLDVTADGIYEVPFNSNAETGVHIRLITSGGNTGTAFFDDVSITNATEDKAASNFTPQVGDDRKVTFEGVTKVNSDAYFYLPTGDTVTRESRSGYGNRGLFSLGAAPTAVNTIEFVNIASTGDSQDFGDLTYTFDGSNAGNSSSTRGIFGGGRSNSANVNTINYVTIASTGDAKDFGDLTQIRRGITGHSNSIRGVFAGGRADPGPNPTDTIDFITISSTGNALDFGNLITARRYSGSTSSSTRGLVAGGADPGKLNSIEYITIPSKGNALDFGDLSNNIDQTEGNSNGVRGIFGGGGSHPNYYNTIDYVTIASTGNAKDFGDLIYTRVDSASASNCIRGVFAGGHNPTKFNDIQYVNISSMGNAFDFGSLSTTSAEGSGCSDSHGGLG